MAEPAPRKRPRAEDDKDEEEEEPNDQGPPAKKACVRFALFTEMDREIVPDVVEFLDAASLANLCGTSRTFRALVDHHLSTAPTDEKAKMPRRRQAEMKLFDREERDTYPWCCHGVLQTWAPHRGAHTLCEKCNTFRTCDIVTKGACKWVCDCQDVYCADCRVKEHARPTDRCDICYERVPRCGCYCCEGCSAQVCDNCRNEAGFCNECGDLAEETALDAVLSLD